MLPDVVFAREGGGEGESVATLEGLDARGECSAVLVARLEINFKEGGELGGGGQYLALFTSFQWWHSPLCARGQHPTLFTSVQWWHFPHHDRRNLPCLGRSYTRWQAECTFFSKMMTRPW